MNTSLPSRIVLIVLLGAAPSGAEPRPAATSHGDKGFEFETDDGNFLLQIQPRFQFRFTYPLSSDPIRLEDLDAPPQTTLRLHRARLKVGGHAHRPWLKYYAEYELGSSNLLDFRVWITRLPEFQLKAGQWKAEFNRERIISSGSQQMVDRSIVNRPFTIDRQQGFCLFGSLDGPGVADVSYWAAVLSGTGRGAAGNDDEQPMWLLRAQWNAFGRLLDFSGSDVAFTDRPAGLVALAAVTNRSPYTRFSQDGGGQLPGFEEGAPGQYRVEQGLAETALQYRGFSWQQELHGKRIRDRLNGTRTTLIGGYVQAGYFVHHAAAWFPKPLEIALRHAVYDPDTGVAEDLQQELSLACNWFFKGHLDKLTAEGTLFTFRDGAGGDKKEGRFRLQWDVSL